MAFTFNGTSQRAALEITALAGYPYSMFVLARVANLTTQAWAMGLCEFTAPDNGSFLGFRGDTGGDPTQLRRGAFGVADGTNGAAFVADTWTALGATITGASAASLYVDGVKTTDTGTIGSFPGNFSFVNFASYVSSSAYSGYLDGRIAHGAIWAATTLSDEDHVSLARGFPPRRVRPGAIAAEAVFLRNAYSRFSKGTGFATSNSPTASEHPRIYGG